MFKLRIKEGEKIVIKDTRRSGINCTLEHGKEYPQELLAKLHANGAKFVTKTKTTRKTKTT